jgi:hypothetical protein
VDDCLDHGGRWYKECDFGEQSDLNIMGTSWVSSGGYFANDTLTFVSTNDVEYFMGELERKFNSKYEQSNDTITFLTQTFACEMDDVAKYPPDLRQTFLLAEDSLILLNLENCNDERWESPNSERMSQLNNFFRVK